MQKKGAAIVFTAGDLVGHLNCRYLTRLDLKVAQGELAKPKLRDDPTLDTLLERGKTHRFSAHGPRGHRVLFLSRAVCCLDWNCKTTPNEHPAGASAPPGAWLVFAAD